MAKDKDKGQEPTEGQEPQEPTATTGTTPTEGTATPEPQTFDAAYVKALRDEAASYRKQLREVQQALAEQENAKSKAEEERLAQQQEWQKLAEKREAEVTKLKADLQERDLRAQESRNEKAIADAAFSLGIAPELARRVIPWADLKHDDEGNPINAEALLKAAIEEFNLHTKQAKAGVPPSPKAAGDGKLTDEERRKRAYFPRI